MYVDLFLMLSGYSSPVFLVLFAILEGFLKCDLIQFLIVFSEVDLINHISQQSLAIQFERDQFEPRGARRLLNVEKTDGLC